MSVENELRRALAYNDTAKIDRCFSSIFNDYYKLCLFVVAPYVSASDEAEDIVQDIFVNFFNSILNGRILTIDNIKQYLCVSARNRAINNAKHNALIKNVPFDENSIPSYDLSSDFFSEQLKELWSNLSIYDKKLLVDHVILDRTFKEIAEDTNNSLNTVKSQYRRLILKLRKELR